jgi:hypothetical protein
MATYSADWGRATWGPYGVARAYSDLCETVAVGMGELIISSLRVGNDTAMVATRAGANPRYLGHIRPASRRIFELDQRTGSC